MPLLDVVLGYDCNLKCSYCTITDEMRQRATPIERIVREIDAASHKGWDRIAFTGGEPTIFPELPKLIRYAKRRGFAEVKIASNGLRYAHEPYLDHLIEVGANLFHMSMHAFDDAAYEKTVQRIETAQLRRRAIENLVKRQRPPVADLILKNDTLEGLQGWIESLHRQGITKFNLWLVSLTDHNARNIEQLPKISTVTPRLKHIFDAAREGQYQVNSLHIPRCLLPGYEHHVKHPGQDGVRVITPDEVFDLSASRLTGGVKPESVCGKCRYNETCPGLRQDYVEQFGTGELQPVTA